MKISSRRALVSSLILIALAACSTSSGTDGRPAGGGSPSEPGGPGVKPFEAPTTPPAAPSDGTPESYGYAVEGAKAFYLVGNALTKGDESLSVSVTPRADSKAIDLWLDGRFVARVTTGGAAAVKLEAALAGLDAADHVVLLAESGAAEAFASIPFTLSHPYYVFVSNDWDDPDNDPTDKVLGMQEELHARHAELKITHFVGPYTFTDPGVTEARRRALVKWVLGMQDTHGDEIGLHIHPWCSFVTAAGLTCITHPSFRYAAGSTQADTSGYTVVLELYDHDQMLTLLKKADSLFGQYGLPKPTSFRAGGWSAEIHTLQALADDGFVIDASGANWSRLGYWQGRLLYDWNKEHWATINDTSQPYYPSKTALLKDEAPHVPLLEVPDNGILVDYITGAEMVKVFDANWSGGALKGPKALSIGYHPSSLVDNPAWLTRLHQAMDHADKFLASKGNGPVVYVRGSDLPKAIPLAN